MHVINAVSIAVFGGVLGGIATIAALLVTNANDGDAGRLEYFANVHAMRSFLNTEHPQVLRIAEYYLSRYR